MATFCTTKEVLVEKSNTIVSDIDTKLTCSLILFPHAHSSSSWGSASPLYSASLSICMSARSLRFCCELQRCWARNIANWLRQFTPQSWIIKDSLFDENACLEGWTVQAPCWRDPSNTNNGASQFDQTDWTWWRGTHWMSGLCGTCFPYKRLFNWAQDHELGSLTSTLWRLDCAQFDHWASKSDATWW